LSEGPVSGRHRQPDPHAPQHLLGAQPVDRRVGRGPAVRRPGRGLVRRSPRRHAAAVGRPGPVGGALPARHRLLGPQAGGVRELRLPRRPVPDDPVPDRVRPVLRRPGRAGRHQGLPENPSTRGPHERSRRRRRVADPAGRPGGVHGRGRDRGSDGACRAPGPDRRGRGPAGFEGLRCPVDPHGGNAWPRRERTRPRRRRRTG
jgi:hypothetical protein